MRILLVTFLVFLSSCLFNTLAYALSDRCIEIEQKSGLGLNEAECYVLEHVEKGERALFVISDKRDADSQERFSKLENRTLSADFLKKLLTGSLTDLKVTDEGVSIWNALVKDALHLDNANIAFPIQLFNCTFEEEVNFSMAKFSAKADFYEAEFQKTAIFLFTQFSAEADFSQANFGDVVIFPGVEFLDGVSFRKAQISVGAEFSGAQFKGWADFSETSFKDRSEVKFDKAQFWDGANFESAKFLGTSSFNKTHFLGRAYFRLTHFSGLADFGGAQFSEETYFSGIQFLGDTNFVNAQFLKNAQFEKSKFYGEADFSKVLFSGEADFGGVQFSNSTFFRDSKFRDLSDFKKCRYHRRTFFDNVTGFSNMQIEWEYSSDRSDHDTAEKNIKRRELKYHLKYNETFYIALIKNYRDMGWFQEADDCFYTYRAKKRKYLLGKINDSKEDDNSNLFAISKFWHKIKLYGEYLLLDFAFGYGVKPSKILRTFLLLWLSFSFYYVGFLRSKYGEKLPWWKAWNPFYKPSRFAWALLYSFDKLTPAIKFNSLATLNPNVFIRQNSKRVIYVERIQNLLGWYWFALFLILFSRVWIR